MTEIGLAILNLLDSTFRLEIPITGLKIGRFGNSSAIKNLLTHKPQSASLAKPCRLSHHSLQ
jgi:hypothetical protein